METNFGASAPYTVGVEEEFQLVDPTSLALAPAIEAVLAARDTRGLSADFVTSELSASCLETRSPVCGTVAELATELSALRRRVQDLVRALRPVAQDLGCEAELQGVLEILEGRTGAEKQRAVLGERGSLRDVVAYLVAATA